MIDWTRLAGKVWEALNGQADKGSSISKDDTSFYDYQVMQWYDNIPDDLQLHRIGSGYQPATTTQNRQDPLYLPSILYLRKAHLRNLIYRPFLHSSTRIAQNKSYASKAIQVAKEAVNTLYDLNRKSEVVSKGALFFKHLVLTAFGNLLLGLVNATAEFREDVREEFHLALGLIRQLSSCSAPLRRLWHRLKGLEELQTNMSRSLSQRHDQTGNEPSSPSADTTHSQRATLPSFPVVPDASSGGYPIEFQIGGPQLRDEFASLFDSLGPGSLFEFPIVDFTST